MIHISQLTVGDRIQSLKYGKKVEGTITILLPGAVVIKADSGKEEVVDIDRVVKIITSKNNVTLKATKSDNKNGKKSK